MFSQGSLFLQNLPFETWNSSFPFLANTKGERAVYLHYFKLVALCS